jgi:homoserine kinase type II
VAVYTTFEQRDIEQVCAAFVLGAPRSWRGIPQGSINTNYVLQTEQGRFFLRHTTVRSPDDLQFEAAFLDHLHRLGFAAPTLRRTPTGQSDIPLRGGRASVFGWLLGTERGRADFEPPHAHALGQELGALHRVGESFGERRQNPYGPPVVQGWLEGLERVTDEEVRGLVPELRAALEASRGYCTGAPRGTIHADLFMDNVKWQGDRVEAFFDFEMACTDAWVLDLGITLNAWCFDGGYHAPLCRALFEGYVQERPLGPGEGRALFDATLFGAVRYTASRIRDFHLSALPADRLFPKSFRTYLARVRELGALGPEGFLRLLG